MTAEFLREQFTRALPYAAYVCSGTHEHARRWQQVYDLAAVTPAEHQLLAGFTRQMNVLVVSGLWCGDCVQQGPLLQRIAEAQPNAISLRWVDRDVQKELSDHLKINGGARVPVAVFLSEDFELCGVYGERTLSRYRAIAQRQLGASCSTGIIAPAQDELAATLADWLNEFERMHLMLRLSPRLRQRHGD